MEQIDFPHSTISYQEPVITITFKEGIHLDVLETREILEANAKLSGGKPYLLLSDARVFLTITPESRKVWADKNESHLIIANASLLNNLALRLTANFFIVFNQPHFKYQVFGNKKTALNWLMQFAPGKK